MKSITLSCLMLFLHLATTDTFAQDNPRSGDAVNGRLFKAIDDDNVDELSSLISKDIDLDKLRRPKGRRGRTLLQYAVKHGKPEVVRYLIKEGADLEAKSATGKTAYDYAKQYRRDSIARLLKQAGAKGAIPITKTQLIEDLEQFRTILHQQSSYLYSHGLNPDAEIDRLISTIKDSVNIDDVYYEMVKILGRVGDRHSRLKTKRLAGQNLSLPFALAPLNGKAVALVVGEKEAPYDIYLKKYPYLKAIDDILLDEFIDQTSWRHRYAPKYAKFHRAVSDLNEKLQPPYYHGRAGQQKNTFEFTFTNGKKDKTVTLQLTGTSNRKVAWQDQAYRPSFDNIKIIGKNTGYISIPVMTRKTSVLELIAEKMQSFKNTDALIIDVRNNGGGSRDILMLLAPYFMSPEAKPWVANVAKIRNNQQISEDISSMQGRYLFNYRSDSVSDLDRKSIDTFMGNFTTEWEYNRSRFSDFFYMIIRHDKGKDHYYYDKPVYILANERSFSAASVFTTAMKGMGNVKTAGVCTDGSSGRSRKFDLNHSKINLKISTMISFQRNGKTLDTHGTEPDIFIPKDMEQVLGKRDSQLEQLLVYIDASGK